MTKQALNPLNKSGLRKALIILEQHVNGTQHNLKEYLVHQT